MREKYALLKRFQAKFSGYETALLMLEQFYQYKV